MDKQQIINLIKQNPEISYEDLIRKANEQGIPEELIKEAWNEVKTTKPEIPVSSEEGISEKSKSQKKYNSILMALSNFVIPGFAYLSMRKYGRLFISFIPLFIVGFFFGPTNLLAVIIVVIAIDSGIQANKLNKGTQVLQEKNSTKNFLGGLMIILFILLLIGVEMGIKNIFANTAQTCRLFYPFNTQGQLNCTTATEEKETEGKLETFESEAITVAECDDIKNDTSLNSGSNTSYDFVDLCYFQKAVETNNVEYCRDHIAYPHENCIQYMAITQNQPAFCEKFGYEHQKEACLTSIEDKKFDMKKRCGDIYDSEHIKNRCETEYKQLWDAIDPFIDKSLDNLRFR
ncbi:hypothetical protein KKG71_05890 [Patescibacteria group bacterium]|nr:hypothetical protein [Patescibacteria group bacterium]